MQTTSLGHRLSAAAGAGLLSLVLAGCGGGGGSGGGAAPSTPTATPAAASGQSVGIVTGFGSIFVNGVEFDTKGASFSKNGDSVNEHDLKVGQVVTVTGTRADDRKSGTATQVVMKSNVEGAITNIDLTNSQITVLGQTIQLDASTVVEGFATADINGLTVGDMIEVSGLPAADGSVLATHIEKLTATPANLELRGTVASLDSANKHFSIGAQDIDYSTATLVGFSSTPIADGDKVEVKGPPPANGAPLVATRVEREDKKLAGGQGAHSEVEGLITRFASATDFDVAGQKVTTNSSTTFVHGAAADLKMGARVEAEGAVDANGVLVATKIQVKAASKSRIAGTIDSVNSTDKQFTVLGQVVAVDSNTQFEDKSAAHKPSFNFGDLAANDFVIVRGVPGTNGVDIIATRVERRDANSQEAKEVRGKVTEINKPTFVVTGVTVTVDSSTQLQGSHDAKLTLDDFFAQLKVGDQVEVKGTSTGTAALTATKVEPD